MKNKLNRFLSQIKQKLGVFMPKFFAFLKNNRNVVTGTLLLIIISSIAIYITYAFFSATASHNVIDATVGHYLNPDLEISYMVENRKANGAGNGNYIAYWNAPVGDYTFNENKSFCTNGATYSRNTSTNEISVSSTGKAKCEFYFEADTISYDNDTEYRFFKEDPNKLGTYDSSREYSVDGLLLTGYKYSSVKSKCNDGSTITFNELSKTVSVSTLSPTRCDIYFDYELTPVIKDVTAIKEGSDITVSVDLHSSSPEASTYYYSLDGATYVNSSSSTHTFTNAISQEIYVYASNDAGSSYKTFKELPYEFTGDYDYTGGVQTFTAVVAGNYKLEVWGAQGGFTVNEGVGGKGGYSSGVITLAAGDTLSIYVGGQGQSPAGTSTNASGGYNGGGTGGYSSQSAYSSGSGGGATDIRILGTSLYYRVIVAGGGGGTGYYTSNGKVNGGYGGGTTGESIYFSGSYYGNGGSQTAGGSGAIAGSFGVGGAGSTSSGYARSGGGGGWYGGGGSVRTGAGGGSGYVWSAATASSAPSGYGVTAAYYLTSTELLAGNVSFKSPTGTDETGHTGNGYARITYVGE